VSGNAEIKAISTFQSQGKRPVQEDFLMVQREKGIFIAADGFGNPSLTPAKVACEAVQSFLFKEAGDLDATLPFVLRTYFSLAGNVLFNALIHANRKLMNLNQGKSMSEKGGTSMVAGFLDGDLLALANVGDCSAWIFREDRCADLVIPRSYSRLVDPFGKANTGDLRAPLMALGMAEDLEPEIIECKIQPGDWIAFATDGIPNELREKILEIKLKKLNLAQAVKDFQKALEGLLSEGKSDKGNVNTHDNAVISLIIF